MTNSSPALSCLHSHRHSLPSQTLCLFLCDIFMSTPANTPSAAGTQTISSSSFQIHKFSEGIWYTALLHRFLTLIVLSLYLTTCHIIYQFLQNHYLNTVYTSLIITYQNLYLLIWKIHNILISCKEPLAGNRCQFSLPTFPQLRSLPLMFPHL